MLKSLVIQNYALIENLEIEFDKGLSIITGETGAGKSILLGAFSLLVGQRAETDVLLDKSRKCVVEATFEIEPYNLQHFFEQNELDYSNQVIIRREILETGRSRAFINDSPVNLSLLKELGDKLVDIHSQHQNSYLSDKNFQLRIIDIIARNATLINNYKETYRKYNEIKKQLTVLVERSAVEKAELDYIQFQFNELEQAKLKAGETLELEEELKTLTHAEEIKTHLTTVESCLLDDESGVLNQLKDSVNHLYKLANIFSKSESLKERLEAVYIELKDLASETARLNESIELDPDKLTVVKQRVDLLYTLYQKHRVNNSDELIALREQLSLKLSNIQSYDAQIANLKEDSEKELKVLHEASKQLRASRVKVIPVIENKVIEILQLLGMPNANFSVRLEELIDFQANGQDNVTYLFTANRQVSLQDITKVASGGEISRVMLAIKSAIASSLAMPAIIFDEIDTGVSGEIADKMGGIMKEMSQNMQVISITHLPQVAAKGNFHFKVYKTDGEKATNTHIRLLSTDERITEIAKMLSGKEVSEAAITNARVLLNN